MEGTITGCALCDNFYDAASYRKWEDSYSCETKYRMYCEFLKHKCTRYSKKNTHIGNGRPQGAFAFTITKSPTDPHTVEDMIKAARKITSQKSCPVKQYAWYYEDKGTAEGVPIHPHIHGMYETESGGRIEAKHFKRAWNLWDENKPMGAGFRGGYHRPVRSEEAYDEYIKKDGGLGENNIPS